MGKRNTRSGWAALSAVALAIALSGCAADSPSAESSPPAASEDYFTPAKPGILPQLGGEKQAAAEAAARAAVETSGVSQSEPADGITIGYLSPLGTAETSLRGENAVIDAAGRFGWDVEVADGQGDPAKIAAGATSLVNRGVDAIIGASINPEFIRQALDVMSERGIPYINILGEVSDTPGIAAQYAYDVTQVEQEMLDGTVEALDADAVVAMITTPIATVYEPAIELFEETADQHDWNIVDSTALDAADLENGARRTANAVLTANAELNGYWVDNSVSLAVVAQVLSQRDLCGTVLLYGHTDEQNNVRQIRDGCVTATTAPVNEANAWAAVDQLAAILSGSIDLEQIPQTREELRDEYGIDLFESQVVTAENAPPEGAYIAPLEDSTSFFLTKWSEQYGL